jgi:hypothetical protein
MKAKHDPVRQLNYLKQTLSQNKKPLGLFLSAGCPLAVEMPEGEYPLIPDIAGISKAVAESLTGDGRYQKLIEELEKSGNSNPNIEEILSFVRALKQVATGASSVRGLTEGDLTELEASISKKIVAVTDVRLPSKNTPYHKLAQWIHLIDRSESPVECFTTNYDLLFEQAFEETGMPYFDGFVGSREPFFDLRAIEESLIPVHWTRLWKIHGSINWFPTDRGDVYRSTEILTDKPSIIHPSHLKYDQSQKMPYLALVNRLNAFLRQPSAVLITNGYSFGDTHLNDAMMNALRANPTAIIIAMLYGSNEIRTENDEVKESRYKTAFEYAKRRFNLSVWAFDEAVIGGVQGRWYIEDGEMLNAQSISTTICRMEKDEAEEEGDEESLRSYQFKIGDFTVFGDFLQELIGDQQFGQFDAQ